MKFSTYILYSKKINKYYVGSTTDLDNRLKEHNSGEGKYTKIGLPWKLIVSFEHITRSDAIKQELKIKKRGCKRFLEDIKLSQPA